MASYPQPGETFGSYLIIDRLGQGGMGAVFRATQTTLNRQVALKVLLPHHAAVEEFRERFSREAGLLATVDSPHIVSIYDFGEYNGCLFIATQLVSGGDLATYLSRHGALPLPLALEITQQLAAALSAAHQAHVIHRDVKPTNVLLGEHEGQPHAYLCDFGIARAGDEAMTQTGTVIGTYAYLAPERIDGAPATPGTDIYALGCLLIALLSGHAPYQGTDMQVAQQHLNAPIPQWEPTSPVLARLNHIVRTSMAKDPQTRYATAQDMRQDLLMALSEASAPAPAPAGPPAGAPTALRNTPVPPGYPPPAAGKPRRSPAVIAAATVAVTVLVAAIGVGAFLLTRSDSSGDTSITSSQRRPSASASASGATSGSTTGTTHRCIDGRSVPASQECGEPQGASGLEAVFPGMPPSATCKRNSLDDLSAAQRRVMTAVRQCDKVLPGGGTVVVTYAAYRDYSTGLAYLNGFYGPTVHAVTDGVVQFDNFRLMGNGGSEIARIYDSASGHPFSVSVACGRDRNKCTDTIGTIQFLPLGGFDS